ncbi:MAG: hypothetical protein KIH01_07915 [Candidatus Freyarchaeota archaeon]|nr:hypothetical protein [Candidatus Jordarchaeia archaeon]
MGTSALNVDASTLIGEGGVKLLVALYMGAANIEEVVRLSGLDERVARAKFNMLQELELVRERKGKISLSSKGKAMLKKAILEYLR